MADSNITVSNLAASSGIGHILLNWSFDDPNARGIEQCRLDAVELWAATTNDRGPDDALLATKIDEGRDKAAHMALTQGAIFYYWIRPRNKARFYGEWYPLSPTGGVVGTTQADGGAWTPFTPIITSSLGALGSIIVGSDNRFKVIGKTCLFRITPFITDNGTGSGQLVITASALPIPAGGTSPGYVLIGARGLAGSYTSLLGIVVNNSGFQLTLVKYDGTYPGATGAGYVMDGSYEVA